MDKEKIQNGRNPEFEQNPELVKIRTGQNSEWTKSQTGKNPK